MNSFSHARFHRQLSAAGTTVRKLLDSTRNPTDPSSVDHTYSDKFHLVELATRGAGAALRTLLTSLGLTEEALQTLLHLATTRTITLRFHAAQRCTYLRTTTYDEASTTKHVTERTGFLAGTTTHQTITTKYDHFWELTTDWQLTAYAGPDPDTAEHRVILTSNTGRVELKTTGKGNETRRPRKQHAEATHEADLSWLLTAAATFSVDRSKPSCRTPRRNADVDAALAFNRGLATWARAVRGYIQTEIFSVVPADVHGLDLSAAATAAGIFAPVLAMFSLEKVEATDDDGVVVGQQQQNPRFSAGDFPTFLAEQKRTLAAKRASIGGAFPDPDVCPASSGLQLITAEEAWLAAALDHSAEVCQQHADVVDAVEDMLRRQLAAAVGKHLQPADFNEYMAFHNRRLFKPAFAPRSLCYAVRRSPDHAPEGAIAIETAADRQPVQSVVLHRRCEEGENGGMKFALGAAAEARMFGDQFLHAVVMHQFSGQAPPRLHLAARARQFSSFVLLVGKIAGADVFEPTGALIVKDKDDLAVPLLLETLPTAAEFRDAVESMSPEQQRFCKAFRQMQLASTVFAVAVVQIKPQLERLLNLPPDALTKEIALTQHLMEIFIEYQVPSDILSFDAARAGEPADPVEAVKQHVAAVGAVVAAAKQKELEQVRQEEEKRLRERSVQSRPAAGGLFGCAARAPVAPAAGGLFGSAPAAAAAAPACFSFGSSAPAGGGGFSPSSPAYSSSYAGVESAPTPTPPQPHSAPKSDGDFSAVPAALDRKLKALDDDGMMRPTKVVPGPVWELSSQAGLLSKPATRFLDVGAQKKERDRAFDLLDALTRSGALPLASSSLHVVIASTHCFDRTVVETIVRDNVNPIEKVERSMLIVAETVQGRPAAGLINEDQRRRVATWSAPKMVRDDPMEGDNTALHNYEE